MMKHNLMIRLEKEEEYRSGRTGGEYERNENESTASEL